jgi:hypothetical protein
MAAARTTQTEPRRTILPKAAFVGALLCFVMVALYVHYDNTGVWFPWSKPVPLPVMVRGSVPVTRFPELPVVGEPELPRPSQNPPNPPNGQNPPHVHTNDQPNGVTVPVIGPVEMLTPKTDSHILMQGIVSLAVLAVTLFVIIAKRYGPRDKHWAFSTVGLIIGFWLKS